MTVNIDLIIPGLFDIPVDELDPSFVKMGLPALNQLLRFGRSYQNRAFDLESILIQSMGWSELKTLPFAQAFAKPELLNSDKVLLFKAVHLKADMYNAIVVPIESNRNNNHKISQIINDLKELFKLDCDIERLQDDLYLMHLKQCTPAQHYPHYLSVIGRKADPFIEQSRQALPWYKLMNEMQMFMHQHEINQDRLESDLLPINSLWFWGAGDLAKLNETDIHWYCDDVLLRQFAEVSGIDCAKLDEVNKTNFSRDSIVIGLEILEALKSPLEAGLRDLLIDLENRIFQPLVKTIRVNKSNLRLRAGSGNDLILGRFSMWQFWKKPKSLLDVIDR
jgi:hypothetical protein